MKEIKQKPAGGKPKTADAARVPKAVVKAAWLQAREAARAGEKQVVGGKDGAYSGAADTGEKGADKLVSTGERVTELAYRGGRKLAERSAGQRRERAKAAQTGGEAAQRHGAGETIAHTSTIEASRPPQTREAGRVSDENRPAGARPQQRESRAVGRAKPIKPGREMKQGAPGPKTTEQAGKARQAVQAAARNGQAKARFTQRAQQTAKRAVDTTKRATDAARAGMRALVEALHSLLIALAAGGSVAVLIVVLICLIAFVAGSAYGIFFAAEAPGEDAFTVQQAVEQLGGEYRDYLQQIESTMPHDRQEIKANDDVYYIRWQDVLAVFSSYVSGAEDGAPVAYLDESRLQQLRQTMWDMNEVAYSTYFVESKALQLILNQTNELCIKYGIEFCADIRYGNFLFMTFPDVFSLFENALCNAVNACLQLGEEEKKRIELRVFRQHEQIVVLLANTYNKANTRSNTYALHPHHEHGYGIQNIKRVIRKYNGTYLVKKEDVYKLMISFPLDVGNVKI